jgi:hypothetical protein
MLFWLWNPSCLSLCVFADVENGTATRSFDASAYTYRDLLY